MAISTKNYICPFCSTVKRPFWFKMVEEKIPALFKKDVNKLEAGICSECREISIWKDNNLFYPKLFKIITPSPNLPENVKNKYIEACQTSRFSKSGAIILLSHLYADVTNTEVEKIDMDREFTQEDVFEMCRKVNGVFK